MNSVHIRPDHVEPRVCPDPDKHEGLRTTLADMKQHLIDVHGFVYDEARIAKKAALRRTCPTCHGEGWIGCAELEC